MKPQNTELYKVVGLFPELTLEERLASLRQVAVGRIVFTTSLGMEDQAIAHAIFSQNLDIEIVTLDTGRLFAEHYVLWAETEARYSAKIASVFPCRKAVEAMVAKQGINGFYDSVENRKACCSVRKVEPLGRILAGADVWITGLRAAQTAGRGQLEFIGWDGVRKLQKTNPLLDWSTEQLEAYIASHNVPVNPLHVKGYPSIGCQPCTRAVTTGQNERSGRWWWEQNIKGEAGQECGLHIGPDGRLVRAKS